MSLSASEKATLNFYRWELRGRGWYLFDHPVDIEPPYERFEHRSHEPRDRIDDGRVPSIFGMLTKVISPPKKEVKEEVSELSPTFLKASDVPELAGVSISFAQGQEIRSEVFIELLNMLSFTSNPISFEILGNSEHITIQLVSSQEDKEHISSYLKAYFPTIILNDIEPDNLGFNMEKDIAIADFGMDDIFMQPIERAVNFSIDPLTSLIANMENLEPMDTAMVQIIFKGVTAPWSRDVLTSVSDGMGGSFFANAPEILPRAKEKVSQPLFSVVLRIAAQGDTNKRSEYLASLLSRSILSISSSQYNKLIPLSNEGYSYDFHQYNLYHRTSNRLGFILNSRELATFVHYPNKTVVSKKLGLQGGKTKRVSKEYVHGIFSLGINIHNGEKIGVGLSDEARLRHTHIIGATGVGKSTLIANMMIQDMEHGNGCCLFDPHGDIVEDVLARIPEHRIDDVVLIDPSNLDYPTGFNLLHAQTEVEKIVLSSDLVGAFKRYATAWGDNMSAVLQQAVNAFLESKRGGTLIELKRFLIEHTFRSDFLKSVDDPSIHYYFDHEYKMVRKSISPLLTRIDTFLRPKTVRYMLAQKKGVDFKVCIEQKKIVLIKLSQGLIGSENSFLLGSLFLSKFNQVAMGRQSLPKEERHPYYIYCDEFQNFITDSITSMLSGARKYGLGLILAHQELAQIDDTKVLNSVISNPFVRICFRLGDNDAKKMESGFSYFEQSDLQSLGTGEAIIRIGSSLNDCNLKTAPLVSVDERSAQIKRMRIVSNTQEQYGTPRREIEELLETLFPRYRAGKDEQDSSVTEDNSEPKPISSFSGEPNETTLLSTEKITSEESDTFEIQKESYLKQAKSQETFRKHRVLQNFVRTMAQQHGYRVHIEDELSDGKRVDVGLQRDGIKIAIEVAVSNTVVYEVANIGKCLNNDYQVVYVISESEKHLKNIEQGVKKNYPTKDRKRVFYLHPDQLHLYLDLPLQEEAESPPTRVKGWKIDVKYHPDDTETSGESGIKKRLIKLLKNKK